MPILTKGTTFADGDQVTSTKLNNLVDAAVFRTGTNEAVDNATLLIDAGGYLKVGTVQTGNIATNAITTAKIADANVTTAKIANSAVTTTKIADGDVTAAKLDGAQSGSAPIFGARAWVNFDGTKDSGGAASTANTNRLIRASGNVASVLRNGTGDYTITFTTAMPDADYAVVAFSDVNGVFGGSFQSIVSISTSNPQTASAVRIVTIGDGPNASVNDKSIICLAVFR